MGLHARELQGRNIYSCLNFDLELEMYIIRLKMSNISTLANSSLDVKYQKFTNTATWYTSNCYHGSHSMEQTRAPLIYFNEK